MVSSDGRNNIIALAYISGFAVLIISFIYSFIGNMEGVTDKVTYQVNKGIDNVTDSNAALSASVGNLTSTVNQLLFFQQQEREQNEKNLGIFLSAFGNQSRDMITAINILSTGSNASREEQTKAFVETLQESQNLTRYNQNLTEQRLVLENATLQRLNDLATVLNVSNNNWDMDNTRYEDAHNITSPTPQN